MALIHQTNKKNSGRTDRQVRQRQVRQTERDRQACLADRDRQVRQSQIRQTDRLDRDVWQTETDRLDRQTERDRDVWQTETDRYGRQACLADRQTG